MNWESISDFELEAIEVATVFLFGAFTAYAYYVLFREAYPLHPLIVLLFIGTVLIALATFKTLGQNQAQLETLQNQLETIRDHEAEVESIKDQLDRLAEKVEVRENGQQPESGTSQLKRLFDKHSRSADEFEWGDS